MAINECIEEQDRNFFSEGVKALQQRWEKYVDPRRNCVLWELISCVFHYLLIKPHMLKTACLLTGWLTVYTCQV